MMRGIEDLNVQVDDITQQINVKVQENYCFMISSLECTFQKQLYRIEYKSHTVCMMASKNDLRTNTQRMTYTFFVFLDSHKKHKIFPHIVTGSEMNFFS